MKVLFAISFVCAVLWTIFVIYANSMRSSSDRFVGTNTIVVAWLFVGIFGAAAWTS